MMILDAVSRAARKALLGGRGHQTKLNSGSDAPHFDDDEDGEEDKDKYND